MSRNGAGVYSIAGGTAAVSGAAIGSAAYNTAQQDIADALTDSLSKSGNGAATADISMGTHKLTNVGAPTNPADAATKTYTDTAVATAQPLDADLTALAALAATAGMVARTGAGAFAVRTLAVSGVGLAITNADGASAAPTIAISPTTVGGFRALKVQTTSNSIVAVTADALTVEDGSGNGFRATSVTLAAIDITTVGANGLDTGAAANSTWYAVWVIYNGTTVAGLLSTSATTPTLPSGYTYKARVGMVRTDGSAHFLRTLQYGRTAQYVVGTNPTVAPLIGNGVSGTYSTTSPTLTTASVTSLVPTAVASRINVIATANYHGGALSNVLVAPNTGWGGANNGPNGSANQGWPLFLSAVAATGSGNIFFTQSAWMALEATTIAWAADAAGGAISCMGWEDNL